MAYFDFVKPENCEERSSFANTVYKLIYQKNNGHIDHSAKEAEDDGLFANFDGYVRNIYEIVQTEIPLQAYAELMEHGAGNYDFSEEEYKEAIKKTEEACRLYYS